VSPVRPMMIRRFISAVAAMSALAAAPACAIDGMSLELGSGDAVNMGRIGVQWDWKKRWFQMGGWHLGGYFDLAAGYWHRDDTRPGEHDSLFDLGFTPVFRIQPDSLNGPYIEAGIGFHFLSHSSIGDRRMSTQFQFGDHLGAGYRFGAKGSYDLGYRFQHLSNASIKRPNPGINFHQIRLQYNF